VSNSVINLSLYDLQQKIRIAAATKCMTNTMSLIKNFELFQDCSWWSHS